jgi:preprotein translocase subunit SecG
LSAQCIDFCTQPTLFICIGLIFNVLLKQFEGTRKMMKTVMGANMSNMMRSGGFHGGKKRK